MPIYVMLIIFVILVVVYSVIRLKKSHKFDKFVKDLTGPVEPSMSPEDVIKTIGRNEDKLRQVAKKLNEEADRVKKDSEKIEEYFKQEDEKT